MDLPFVFLDDRGIPYRVQIWGDDAWLFYWHPFAKNWVSYRKVSKAEIWQFNRSAILEEDVADRLYPVR